MSMLFTNTLRRCAVRQFHTQAGLENILGGGPAPPVQVKSIGEDGIQLADGLVIPSACIFLDGQVFLWNVPSKPWKDWTKDHFQIFDVVVPKPGAREQFWTVFVGVQRWQLEILLLGTGKSVAQLPPKLRSHLNQAGIHVDVMDTVRVRSASTVGGRSVLTTMTVERLLYV